MSHINTSARTGEGASAKSDNITMDKDNDFPLNIPEGADLEQPPEKDPGHGFPDGIFEDLPDLLKSPCDILSEQTEKEVFLVGALGIISGILPKVQGFYDGQIVFPNLFVYILGRYGIGKGALKYALQIGSAVHRFKREHSKRLLAAYKEECISAKDNNQPPPDPPGNKVLFIPADNSKSGIIETLDSNDGEGIIAETEADSLADALSKDYGGFSDTCRKAFHAERISLNRRGGSEYREVEQPRLSIVLTSTPDQYQKLIPNVQNGLFSRFLHYRLSPSREFKNVFDPSKSGYPEYFRQLGETFLGNYTTLKEIPDPIVFDLRPHQKERFLKVFDEWKKEVGEYVSTDLDGTVNRLGLICFRIAMIFTALRNFGHGDYSKTMLCEDVDFDNSLRIVEILKRHAIAVFYDLPNPAISREAAKFETELSDKATDVAKSQLHFKAGKSYADIAEIVLGDRTKKSTVYRWLNR